MAPSLSWPGEETTEQLSLPQCTSLSEGRLCDKATYCVTPTVGHSGKDRMGATQRWVVVRAGDRGMEGGGAQRTVGALRRLCVMPHGWAQVPLHLSNPQEAPQE